MKNLLLITVVSLIITRDVHAQITLLQQLETSLASGRSTISDLLTNPVYMPLHPDQSFRELVKKFAKQEKIVLVTPSEPGTRMTVTGKITGKNDKPFPNILVYVYHTDNKGWYSDTAGHVTGMGGDREHARLFGYFRTMNDGSFQFKTIHPQGYPNSDLPQHIHFEVYAGEGNTSLITELLFDDDKRLTPAKREHMVKEGAFVAANTATAGGQLYTYEIVLPE